MAATGLIVQGPLDAVAALNAGALAQARTGYTLMTQILGPSQAAPLITASLPLSAAAIVEGLAAYELSLVAGQLAAAAAQAGGAPAAGGEAGPGPEDSNEGGHGPTALGKAGHGPAALGKAGHGPA